MAERRLHGLQRVLARRRAPLFASTVETVSRGEPWPQIIETAPAGR